MHMYPHFTPPFIPFPMRMIAYAPTCTLVHLLMHICGLPTKMLEWEQGMASEAAEFCP